MIPATRKRIDAILATRKAAAQHAATVQRQLAEVAHQRRTQLQIRAVRTATLSGAIRR